MDCADEIVNIFAPALDGDCACTCKSTTVRAIVSWHQGTKGKYSAATTNHFTVTANPFISLYPLTFLHPSLPPFLSPSPLVPSLVPSLSFLMSKQVLFCVITNNTFCQGNCSCEMSRGTARASFFVDNSQGYCETILYIPDWLLS